MLLTASSFHIHTVMEDQLLLGFTGIMVTMAALTVICSILMLIGVCGDNKNLLLPWLITVSLLTTIDVAISIYLLVVATYNPFIMTLFVIDFVVCSVNIYCILAVITQYQLIKRLIKQRRRVSKSVATDYDDFANCKDFEDEAHVAPPRAKNDIDIDLATVAIVAKRIKEKGQSQLAPSNRSRSLTETPKGAGLRLGRPKRPPLLPLSKDVF
ncbi:hypothetical protein HDE_06039 [Halotydeus destructor]|nr:hypothetical protein HDE_06039 [Halotydeus destructor]